MNYGRNINGLCRMAKEMGYTEHETIVDVGSKVKNFVLFLEDNLGAIDAIYNWVDEHYSQDDFEEEKSEE